MNQRILLAAALSFLAFSPLNADGPENAMATQKAGVAAAAPAGSADKLPFTGSFVYSCPIDIPPGINGVQPNLALSYNSSGGNGWVGVGWDLSLGAIQRSTKNGAPKYTDADVFTFSGGGSTFELVSADGGAVNYRPKIEGSFQRFVREGASWCVYDKDGSRLYFGASAAGRTGPSASQTYQWALEKVVDRNGNWYTVSYANNEGTLYPDTILYTGHDATGKTHRRVKFTTESRPDPYHSYRPAFRMETNLRLARIETSVNPSGAAAGPWSTVKRYTLSYGTRSHGVRSELTSVQVTGIDGASTITLPPHQFNYLATSPSWGEQPGASTFQLPQPMTVARRDNGLRFADLNGDGRLDLVFYMLINGGHNRTSYINTPDGFVQESTKWQVPVPITAEGSNGFWWDNGLRFADVNGDGRTDILQGLYTSGPNVEAWINNGTGFVQSSAWRIPTDYVFTYLTGSWFSDNGVSVIDVNGDGLPDLVQARKQDGGPTFRRVRLNTGSGWEGADAPGWTPPVDAMLMASNGASSVPNGVEYVDLNGDGLVDIVHKCHLMNNHTVSHGVWLNTGHGWVAEPTGGWALPEPLIFRYNTRPFDYGVRFADMNGDGLTDLVQSVHNVSWPAPAMIKTVRLNTGSGWASPQTWTLPEVFSELDMTNNASNNTGTTLLDVNGDGRPDMARWSIINGSSVRRIHLGEANPELLSLVTLPTGGTASATYGVTTSQPGHNIPFPVNVLSSLTSSDGRGGTISKSFAYAGGLFDPVEREFLGFARVDETDASGAKTSTWFHQMTSGMSGNPLKGRVFKTESGTGSQVLVRSETEWEAPLIGTARFARAKATTRTILDGPAPLSTRTEYFYDDSAGAARAGNVIRIVHAGDAASGDERSEEFEFAAPSSGYLPGFPKRHRVLGAAGQSLGETQFLYDGLPYGQAARGNATTVRRWLDKPAPGKWIETHSVYNSSGSVIREIDARGGQSSISYDVAGFPIAASNAAGHATTRVFDLRTGEALSVTDANGQTATTVLDALGRTVKVIGPNDSPTHPTTLHLYTGIGNPSTQHVETQSREKAGTAEVLWTREYFDGLGRVYRTEREDVGDSVVTDVQFDGRGLATGQSVPRRKNAAGSVLWITTAYDALGRATRVTQPDTTFAETTYSGRVTSVRDPLGRWQSSEVDAFGRVIRRTEANDAETTYAYDAAGNLASVRNAKDESTAFTHDSLGRKLSMSDPNAGAWSYSYDDAGNLASQTDPRGVKVTLAYDVLNRLTTRTLSGDPAAVTGKPVGAVLASLDYDETSGRPYSIGRLTSVSDASGTLAYFHDNLGRVVREIRTVDGIAHETRSTFDGAGRVTSLTYPSDNVISYTYNGAGLPDTVTGPSAAVLARFVTYDALGRPLQLDQAGGKTRTFLTFDPVKGVLSRSRTDSFATGAAATIRDVTYQFDANRNITRIVDGVDGGRTQDFVYDALDRLTSASGAYGDEAYAYDVTGNLLSKAGRGYAYEDPLHPSAVTTVGSPGAPGTDADTLIGYGLEPSEPIFSTATTPSFVAGRYNMALSLNGTSDLVSFPASQGHSPARFSVMIWIKPAAYPTGDNYATLIAKAEGRPRNTLTNGWRIVMLNDGRVCFEMANGNRTAYTTAIAAPLNKWTFVAFHYDGEKARFVVNGTYMSNRVFPGVISANTFPVTVGASLDENGTPVAGTFFQGHLDEPRLQGRAWEVDEMRALFANFDSGGSEFTYDAAGNCVSKTSPEGAWSYRYDADGRLFQVLKDGALSATFVYDAFGARVKKITPAGTTRYIGGLYEDRPDGSKVDHVSAGGAALCDIVRQGSTVATYHFHPDHLGSVNLVTGANGQVVQETHYRPFGERHDTTGASPNAHWYTGQEEDPETTLNFYHARYYDPDLGRFISPDSIVPSAMDPQAWNRYAYVRNNPVNLADPTGHSWLSKTVRAVQSEVRQNFAAVGLTLQALDVGSGTALLASKREGQAILIGQALTGASFGLGSALGVGASAGWGAMTGSAISYVSAVNAGVDPRMAVLKGGLEGAVTSAMFSGIDAHVNVLSAIAIKGSISGAIADARGGNFWSAFAVQAGATTANWGFKKLVGYGADPTPGTELKTPGRDYNTIRPPVGKNVVGFNGGYPEAALSQGGFVSRVLNAVPGGNAVAQFHDTWINSVPFLSAQPWNALTIVPSLAVGYAATLSSSFSPLAMEFSGGR